MSEARDILNRAARQLLAIESLLGCEFIPAQANPLPKVDLPQRSAVAATAVASSAAIGTNMSAAEKAAYLAEMDEKEVRECKKCRLCQSRTQTVFGAGDTNADLVFVGEGPGQEEDLQGIPFVGRAGELLTKMITAMGLSREKVFICNMVKCRPPQNRTPMPDEVSACWPFLMRQLQVIQPKVIVTLGNPATQGLLQTKIGITKLRGDWQKLPGLAPGLEGIAVMPTFHPAYVLRNYSVKTRGLVWSDLQQVMSALNLNLPSE